MRKWIWKRRVRWMAGEHVKDAKQATGVRATSQTYNKHNVKLFFKKRLKQGWQKITEKDLAVTIITNTGVMLLSCNAQYYRNNTFRAWEWEEKESRSLSMRVLCSCKSLRLVQSMRFCVSDPVTHAVLYHIAAIFVRNRPSRDTFVNKDCLFYIESKSYSLEKLRRKLNKWNMEYK